MANDGRGIQSIEVGGRILSVLAKSRTPIMLRDLAAAAGLAPAQCHAYLTSYRHAGLVEQDSHSGRYRLGAFALRLGMGRIRSVPLLARGTRALRSLAAQVGVVAMMIVWGPNGPTVLQIQGGTPRLNLNIRQGTLYSITGTASGRVFAAFGQVDGLRDLVASELTGQNASRTFGDVPSRDTFDAAIKRARKLGYADTVGAPIPDISGLSAPVYDEAGRLAYALTLVGRTADLPVDPDSMPVQRLIQAARELSGTDSSELALVRAAR